MVKQQNENVGKFKKFLNNKYLKKAAKPRIDLGRNYL